MAERLKNIAGLFKEGRTRVIVLSTLFILLIAIGIGLYSMRHHIAGGSATAAVNQAPGGIQSIPFEAPNAEYAKLQEQQNTQQAKQAEQAGSSAIPTIIRADNSAAGANTENANTGVEFTALSREQSDAGTFNPKELNLGQNNINCAVTAGTPVYDAQGRLIGYVGADGKVRGLDGKIIGSVDPDGTVRDSNGNIIGKVAQNATFAGTPVYDQNGRLIGYEGADGKVRDANGNIIGTVGPDGLVKDASGKIIGQAGSVIPGTPAYDSKGNLIGYVGSDGKVRDATGRIIGTVGSDGFVRDATGKIIGKLGTPVYDAQGKLLGFAGPDGKLRDANGNIIGTVGPDGIARDLNGNIIGKAGTISPGTPIYDANGNIIGTVGPDGKVRDANGNVIGVVGVDGLVHDSQGNVIGSISKPQVTTAQAPQTQQQAAQQSAQQAQLSAAAAAALRQEEVLKDQRYQQDLLAKQQAMSAQANQLLVAWAAPTQSYVAGANATPTGANAAGGGGGGSTTTTTTTTGPTGPVFIKAGTVYFATINTAVNSDEPGPVLATIVTGNFSGGRLLGTLTNQGQAVMISFNNLSLPTFSKSIQINAVAIDQNTARTALSTETNNHILLRYGSVFAAAFAQGYGQAFSTSGSSLSSTGLTTTTTTPNISPAGKFFVALGNVGTQIGSQLGNTFNTPPTVYVASGTAVGILFLSDVQLPTS